MPRDNVPVDASARVDLLSIADLLRDVLTEALCATIFKRVRIGERERVWTLFLLVEFWTAVALKAPRSLAAALSQISPGWTREPVVATSESFYQRCRDLPCRFFAELYREFIGRVVKDAPLAFAQELQHIRHHFPSVLIVDGSKLDKIARSLSILRSTVCSVLPGSLFVAYDLFRGIASHFCFDPDASRSESHQFQRMIQNIPAGTLLVGDRGFAKPLLFNEIRQKGIHCVFRRDPHCKIRRRRKLGSYRIAGAIVEDWEVEAGSGWWKTPKQHLRMIVRRKPHFELLTSVLDPAQLSAADVLGLYRRRWSIERLFYDLKCVLKLREFYAANPNGVAMQVYAAALVHTAMRIGQARIAQQFNVPGERLSVQRILTRLVIASKGAAEFQLGVESVVEANPTLKITIPSASERPFAHTTLGSLLTSTRPRVRKNRRRPGGISHRWTSMRHFKKGKKYLDGLT